MSHHGVVERRAYVKYTARCRNRDGAYLNTQANEISCPSDSVHQLKNGAKTSFQTLRSHFRILATAAGTGIRMEDGSHRYPFEFRSRSTATVGDDGLIFEQ